MIQRRIVDFDRGVVIMDEDEYLRTILRSLRELIRRRRRQRPRRRSCRHASEGREVSRPLSEQQTDLLQQIMGRKQT
jgi:hypothetical protein